MAAISTMKIISGFNLKMSQSVLLHVRPWRELFRTNIAFEWFIPGM